MNSTSPGTRARSLSSRPGFKRLVAMKINGPMAPPCRGLDGGNIRVAGRVTVCYSMAGAALPAEHVGEVYERVRSAIGSEHTAELDSDEHAAFVTALLGVCLPSPRRRQRT